MQTEATSRRQAHEYETIYLLQPQTPPTEAAKVSDRVEDVVRRLEGKLLKVDNWGKRRLAYPIRKNTRGIFIYFKYVGFNDIVAEIERNLRLLDPVMRFQTVRVRGQVDPSAYAIDPEEVKFDHLEVTEDEPEEDSDRRLFGSESSPPPSADEDDDVSSDLEPEAEADADAEAGAAPETSGADEE
jgi:small subunit ribosomal protein S6